MERITIFDTGPGTVRSECPAIAWKLDESRPGLAEKAKQFFRDSYIAASLLGAATTAAIPDSPAAVIVATGGNLGGAIISLPLIKAARKRWPAAHLAIVSNTQQGLEIVRFAGLGDSFYHIPNLTIKQSFSDTTLKDAKRKLRKLRASVYIGNHDFNLSHLLASLRIPVRIGSTGYGVSGNRLLWDKMFNIKVDCIPHRNWLNSYEDIVRTFGGDTTGEPEIRVNEEDKRNARHALQSAGLEPGQRTVAVQAGVWKAQSFKQWPLPMLVDCCVRLERSGMIPVIIGPPGQEQILDVIKEQAPALKVLDFIGKTNTNEAAALVSACDVSIVNDSGLMHLSAAVGTPTVAIFGMTDPGITWSFGSNSKHRIIRRSDCRPCYALTEDLYNHCTSKPCLANISVEKVVEAVEVVTRINRPSGPNS
ncbi:MAG: glycosyltransferase family 9 protein [Chitinophagaceae bacterium]|nr:glycosyltransferase family 9 protein [Chitinophagaceae bacterium]